MLKFIRGKGQQPSIERQRLQNELFAYTKTTQHGFPHKPSAMAYNSKMNLIAIGTQTGAIKIFGRPGVEFYGQLVCNGANVTECSILMLEWVASTGRLLSLSSANQLILWEPRGSILNRVHALSFEGKLKKISSLCCSMSKDFVWVGTEGGNVYQLELLSFTNKQQIICHDTILEHTPNTYRLNPGAVESIKQLPNAWNKLLVAYNRGLCILWDLSENCVLKTFIASGHGQSIGLYLNPNGTEFSWYHADGSFATWGIEDSEPPENQDYVPYGPDPCKSITNLVKGLRGEDEIVVFAGGMPRSAYGDRHCVSIHCSDGHKVCLDFTSKVIDFTVVFMDPDPQQVDILVVLLEEEICAFDLTHPEFIPIKIPYLHSIHASAVTCNSLVSEVKPEVYEMIKNAGDLQNQHFSDKEWPINGGFVQENETKNATYEVLITGHEDGSVKFWDCTGIILVPLYHFKTAKFFGHDETFSSCDNIDSTGETEPPFKKSGNFDPYSDDPRLAIKKVTLCPKTGHLAVAGTAGHIIIADFDSEPNEGPPNATTINLVSDRDGFVWKGHDELKISTNTTDDHSTISPNIHINGIVQVLPPAAITCLTLQTVNCLVAAGTAHGLILFDYKNSHVVLSRCTLNANDLSGASEQLSRRKSFKKTLRESFRRLRKGRSTRSARNSTRKTIAETRPIERQVEARPVDDALSSMVRCLVFGKTYITNVHNTVPTLWVATNSSCVSIFILHINNNASNNPITAQHAKEIQLKHRAPIVSVVLFDQTGCPLDYQSPGVGLHRVLIASEEQFKVFSLPHLKPITKYKLTAHEGARVRRLAVARFSCQLPEEITANLPNKILNANVDLCLDGDDPNVRRYTEFGLLCLTNLGECLVLSIPELKRQLNVAAVRREDINGISSLCFTSSGQALYMISSSELQRISLSKMKVIIPDGTLDLEPLQKNIADTSMTEDANVNQLKNEHENENGSIEDDHLGKADSNTAVNDDTVNHANDAADSFVEDITIDSVKDHLNSTSTTLCSTTEEVISRLSISNTQTSSSLISAIIKDPTIINNTHLSDLSPLGDKIEKHSGSLTIRSCVTSISPKMPNNENEDHSPRMGKESSF